MKTKNNKKIDRDIDDRSSTTERSISSSNMDLINELQHVKKMGEGEYHLASEEIERECIPYRSIGFGLTAENAVIPMIELAEPLEKDAFIEWKGMVNWHVLTFNKILDKIFLELKFESDKILRFHLKPAPELIKWLELVISSDGIVGFLDARGEQLGAVKVPVSIPKYIIESGGLVPYSEVPETIPKNIMGMIWCFGTEEELDRSYIQLESRKNELNAMDAAVMRAFNPGAVEQPWTMGVICGQSSLNTLEKWFERKRKGNEIDFCAGDTCMGAERIVELLHMIPIEEDMRIVKKPGEI